MTDADVEHAHSLVVQYEKILLQCDVGLMLDLHDATIKDRRCKPIKYSNDTGLPSLVLRNILFEEAARR